MSDFSEKLYYYVQRSGLSNTNVARSCGIERSLFQKYVSGSRLPTDVDSLNLLAEQLMLTPEEKKELRDAYQRQRIGEEKFEKYMKIRSLLAEFREVFKMPRILTRLEMPAGMEEYPDILPVKGRGAVRKTVDSLFAYEAACGMKDIYVIANPDKKDSMDELANISLKYGVVLHHIICIDQEIVGGKAVEYNLELLRHVMPMLRLKERYDLKFYYDHAPSHLNTMSLFPGMAVSERKAVLIEPGNQRAMIIGDQETVDMLRERALELEQKCRPLITNFRGEKPYLTAEMYGIIGQIQWNPPTYFGMTEELMEKVIYKDLPDREVRIRATVASLKVRRKHAADKKKPIGRYYFTEEGVRGFLDKGKSGNFPPNMNRELELEESIRMMQNMVDDTRAGILDCHIIAAESEYPDPDLVLDVCEDRTIRFLYRKETPWTALSLHEAGLFRAFWDYMEWLKEDSGVLSAEETCQRIESILEEYREKDI